MCYVNIYPSSNNNTTQNSGNCISYGSYVTEVFFKTCFVSFNFFIIYHSSSVIIVHVLIFSILHDMFHPLLHINFKNGFQTKLLWTRTEVMWVHFFIVLWIILPNNFNITSSFYYITRICFIPNYYCHLQPCQKVLALFICVRWLLQYIGLLLYIQCRHLF